MFSLVESIRCKSDVSDGRRVAQFEGQSVASIRAASLLRRPIRASQALESRGSGSSAFVANFSQLAWPLVATEHGSSLRRSERTRAESRKPKSSRVIMSNHSCSCISSAIRDGSESSVKCSVRLAAPTSHFDPYKHSIKTNSKSNINNITKNNNNNNKKPTINTKCQKAAQVMTHFNLVFPIAGLLLLTAVIAANAKIHEELASTLPVYEPIRQLRGQNSAQQVDSNNRTEAQEARSRLADSVNQVYKMDRVAQLDDQRREPRASSSANSPEFSRINELDAFLGEMDQRELHRVAGGKMIDDLFQPRPLALAQAYNTNPLPTSHVESESRQTSGTQRVTGLGEIRKLSSAANGLLASQSMDRSSISECALILQRTYVKNMGDPKLPSVPFGRTEQACITYTHINKAVEQAKHKLKFAEMAKKRKLNPLSGKPLPPVEVIHSTLEPPQDLIAALGEINMATTQILADQFDLSNDELLNGLPLIDMSKTHFWPLCPLLVRQDLKCELTRFRTFTAHCNNLKHPTWGAAMTPFARYLPPVHLDGIWVPRKSVVAELSHHGHSPSISHPLFMTEHIPNPAVPLSKHLDKLINHIDNSPALDEMSFASSVQFERHAHPSLRDPFDASSSLIDPASAPDNPEASGGESLIDANYEKLKSSIVRTGLLGEPIDRQAAPIQAMMEPRGTPAKELPPVRVISSVVHRDVDIPNHDLSILFMSWGQLLDHDMTRAAQSPPSIKCCGNEQPKHKLCMPIKVPEDDPFYSKFRVKCLEFRRSLAGLRPNCVLGPRVHQNAITSPIDANFVYGSSKAEAESLRLFRGGRLRDRDWFKHQSLKPLLPAQEEDPNNDCLGRPNNLFCFKAGDVRVNEQIHLTVLHTLYMREHNRIADRLADLNPHWSDERIYQETRHIVAATVQHTMLTEYIPLLIGDKMSQLYNLTGHLNSITIHKHDGAYWHGYDPSVTTSVSNSFAVAAFRFGHTFIQGNVERYNKYHEFIGSEKLRHLFKQPFLLYQPGALDELTLGLINQPTQSNDPFISQEVAGHLFQPPESQFGHDLPSINLQRGRDQGLPGYNLFREWCGLPRAETFNDLVPFLTNHTAYLYSRLYKHVDDIDLWSGGISERRLPGAAIGPTFACIIARQFSNTRRGDRFWYENAGFPSSFTPEQLAEIRKISLAKTLCANADDLPTIQRWALRMPHPVLNPHVPCDKLADIDLRYWQED